MFDRLFLIRIRLGAGVKIGIVMALIQASGDGSAVAQQVDIAFAPTVPYQIGAFGVQDDGKIVVGELYETFAAFTDMRRFMPDGSIDSTFNHFGNALQTSNNGQVARVDSVSCFMDGTVALSGTFDLIDGFHTVPRIVKFDREGRKFFYPAPLTDALDWVVSPHIAALPDNRAMIWGYFSRVAGVSRRGAALLNSSGYWLNSFNPNPVSNSTGSSVEIDHRVTCMLQQPDGKFLISGTFDRIGGRNYPYLARVDASGAADPLFQPNPNAACFSMALQADGKILVSGNFSEIGGGFRSGIARLNANGTLDPTFNSEANAAIYSLVVRTDGRILISGNFTLVNGIPRGRLALLNSDGSLNESYGFSTYSNGMIAGLFVQEDGKPLLAGGFSQIGSTTRVNLGRLMADVPAESQVEVDAEGTELTWQRTGSVQEIDHAEFRLSLDGSNFKSLLGRGRRVSGGWKLENLKLPGNKVFHIQVKGLARGGYLNSSTSVMRSVTQLFRPLPQIVSGPMNQTVVAGTAGVMFSANATSAATLVYQWKRDGKPIPGGSSSTYTIPGGVTTAHAGKYSCTISSSAGSVTTASALLTVITPITLTAQPQYQAVIQGKSAVFSVKVAGTSPAYKWFKDNVELTGVTGPTLRISSVIASQHEGIYRVDVSNFAGTVSSADAALHVVDATPTATPPSNKVLAVGQTVGAGIESTIVSESPPVIQWLKNGKPVANAKLPTLSLMPVTLKSAGIYAVKAANPIGSIMSAAADVSVVDQTPKRLVVASGGFATMTATAAGANLTFKWRRGAATYLSDDGNIAGSQSPTLKLSNLSAAEADDYVCEVTAPGGTLNAGVHSLLVSQAVPEILLPLTLPSGMLSADYDFTIPMNPDAGMAPSNFAAKMLPPGLKIDAAGRITGRPTKVGNFLVSLTPSNPSGVGATVFNLPLEVLPITPELVGAFVAFVPGDRTSLLFKQGARLDMVVTPKGAYSGKLSLGALNVRLAGGQLNAGVGVNGVNTLLIPRKGAPPLTLEFSLNEADQTLAGTLSDGNETGTLEGWRNPWSRTLKAGTYQGYYTLALEGAVPVVGTYDHPDGDGSATLNIADSGIVKTAGVLPDGTAFTTATFVGKGGQCAIYAPIYRPTGGYAGGICEVIIDGSAPTYLGNRISGNVRWYKFPLFAGVNYAAGFEAVTLSANGAKYVRPPAGNVLGSNPNAVAPDVVIEFAGARVEEVTTQNPNVSVRMSSAGQFVMPAVGVANPAATSLKLNSATGLFSGSFTFTTKNINNPALANKRTGKVFGVIVRPGLSPTGTGYGAFLLSQPPGTATAEVLSGRVSVRVP